MKDTRKKKKNELLNGVSLMDKDLDGAVLVAVVADPQLTDEASYPWLSRFKLDLVKFYSDLYMRRAFKFGLSRFRPDAVVFLGDIFDGGRTLGSSRTYRRHMRRFRRVFGDPKSEDPKFLFVAGNHDVGIQEWYSKKAAKLFADNFGERSYSVDVCKHRLVFIDSPSLLEKDNHKTQAYLDRAQIAASEGRGDLNVLLFSHVPLWRGERVRCRNSDEVPRYKKDIRASGGESYQNTLPVKVTSRILNDLNPNFVFSGDDHDNCFVQHRWVAQKKIHRAPEHTFGTFSWLQGNVHPSFGILKLTSCSGSDEPPKLSVGVCSLPDQRAVYFGYLKWTIFSLAAIFLWNVIISLGPPRRDKEISLPFVKAGTGEEIADEENEEVLETPDSTSPSSPKDTSSRVAPSGVKKRFSTIVTNGNPFKRNGAADSPKSSENCDPSSDESKTVHKDQRSLWQRFKLNKWKLLKGFLLDTLLVLMYGLSLYLVLLLII